MVEKLEVLAEQEGERLDKYLCEIYPDYSRSFFQRLIKDGNVSVGGQTRKANYRLDRGELLEVSIPAFNFC